MGGCPIFSVCPEHTSSDTVAVVPVSPDTPAVDPTWYNASPRVNMCWSPAPIMSVSNVVSRGIHNLYKLVPTLICAEVW